MQTNRVCQRRLLTTRAVLRYRMRKFFHVIRQAAPKLQYKISEAMNRRPTTRAFHDSRFRN